MTLSAVLRIGITQGVSAKWWKRLSDVLLASVIVIPAVPVLALCSIIVWLETGLSPIFRQERALSLNGRRIRVFKLRTMHNPPAECVSENILFKPGMESYVTRFGSILRRTGIDELPQLLNVIMGEMSFVGPRPLSLTDLSIIQRRAPKLHDRRAKLTVKPGITGFWQLYGRRERGVEELLLLDEFYACNASPLLDLFLCIKTVPVVLFGQHSDAILDTLKSAGLHTTITPSETPEKI